jgi:CPA2 family monovalent cation:H+ antiporter-2
VEIARTLNPRIEVVLRTHSDEEATLLREEQVGEVFMGEHELALAMAGAVVARSGGGPRDAGDGPINVAS